MLDPSTEHDAPGVPPSPVRRAATLALCLIAGEIVVFIVATGLGWNIAVGFGLLTGAGALAVGLPVFHLMTVAPIRSRMRTLGKETESLRGDRDRLAVILERMPVVPYLARPHTAYHMTFVGPQIEHLTGFTGGFLADCPGLWLERVHPTHRVRVARAWRRLLESGSLEHEYLWCVSTGEYRWFHDTLRLVRDADGQAQCAVGTIHDITEWKATWDTLAASRDELRRTIRTFDDDDLRAGEPVGSRWGPMAKQELVEAARDLDRARGEIVTLRALIPVCAHCSGPRRDPDIQGLAESYLVTRPLTHFADTLCADCLANEVKLKPAS